MSLPYSAPLVSEKNTSCLCDTPLPHEHGLCSECCYYLPVRPGPLAQPPGFVHGACAHPAMVEERRWLVGTQVISRTCYGDPVEKNARELCPLFRRGTRESSL